jgi:hypothetical protein
VVGVYGVQISVVCSFVAAQMLYGVCGLFL